jgi:hypothetical protein
MKAIHSSGENESQVFFQLQQKCHPEGRAFRGPKYRRAVQKRCESHINASQNPDKVLSLKSA